MHTFSEMMRHPNLARLDPDYEGCCPCTHIKGDGFDVEIHCWRTSHDCNCPYSGIHITGLDPDDARKLADHLIETIGWPGIEWTVLIR